MKTSEFKIERVVQIHETDLGGLMHHPNYFLWMEQAEYEMFEHLDEPVVGELTEEMEGTGWPRAEVSMKFLKPLRFRDKVEVHLKIMRIRAAAIEYETDFYLIKKDGNKEKVAIGTHKTINCMYDATQKNDPRIVPAADEFLEKLEAYN
ncbi:MAG: acyl-CoA thioesterase [Lentisphaerales bacterium]|nr:acyl-CoA thioesterase [Lentisphaerales bacterium]